LVDDGQTADAMPDHQANRLVNGVVQVDCDDMRGHEILGA
jgi:hypothetical protein